LQKLKLQETCHVSLIIQFLGLQHSKGQLTAVKIEHATLKM